MLIAPRSLRNLQDLFEDLQQGKNAVMRLFLDHLAAFWLLPPMFKVVYHALFHLYVIR